MHLNFDYGSGLNMGRLRWLRVWYRVALGIIAAVAIAGQLLIQSHLSDQMHDSQTINVSGKQRMLSQKIAKTALLLNREQASHQRRSLLTDLQSSVSLFGQSHRALQHSDDSLEVHIQNSEVAALFSTVDDHFNNIQRSAIAIIQILHNDIAAPHDSLAPAIANILAHEQGFLEGMDEIAMWHADHAREKVESLRRMEYALLFITLFVIVLVMILIFAPLARSIDQTMSQLVASEKNALKLSREIGALYASLEKSYEQMAMVNQPVENPRLYARADRGGNLTAVTDYFKGIAHPKAIEGLHISDLFRDMEAPDDWMDTVIDTVSDGRFWQGEVTFSGKKGMLWAMIIITPVYGESEDIEEMLVMGSDITQRKQAEDNMRLKNRAEIEKTINQQKFRSVLILEGQEEERNRIAMDIHDGIGQMLTSLKYQIESIDLNAGEKARKKIDEVDQLIKQVIREVRRVTFNLKPPVLGDYGLQAALNVFIQETSKLVDAKLVYNTSGTIRRLPQKIENNIFRIIQEAINNALKYSGAQTIEVTLRQVDNELVITVRDEGKGFDTKLVEARSINIESGRGFFNMYERTEYVNGELAIQSKPNHGTTVTLTVPIKNAISTEV